MMINSTLNIWENELNSFDGQDDIVNLFSYDNRKKAFSNFLNHGVPNLKHEEWKYTHLSFLNIPFVPVNSEFTLVNSSKVQETVKEMEFDESSNNLIFINGCFSSELSHIKSREDGLFLGSIIEGRKRGVLKVELFEQGSVNSSQPFNFLNDSFFIDGACIIIPDNLILSEPVHVINIVFANDGVSLINPKNIIITGNNSCVKIVESTNLLGSGKCFFNSQTNIVTHRSSTLDYFKLQNVEGDLFRIETVNCEQDDNSVFNTYTISLQGKFIRNNLSSKLSGSGSEANFNGLYFLDGDNFVDNHTLVNHASPNCNSNEVYKGILNDKSTAVFNGKIYVAQDAQKTNAYQTNRNILLSNNCTINTKPQLEIFADDVKCSHGATTGKIDNDALFYLKARGISETKGKLLLLNAFASEIVDRISLPQLRAYMKEQLVQRLGLEEQISQSFEINE
jgi:Fe-S cluster assembly protein SufD